MKYRTSYHMWLGVLLSATLLVFPAFPQANSSNCDNRRGSALVAARLRLSARSELEKYLQSITDPVQRKRAIEIRIGSWLRQDERGVFQWAAEVSNENVQADVARYLVPLIVAEHPELAANLLRSVSSEAVRDDLLTQVLQAWMKTDWETALVWSQRLPQSRFKEEALIHLSYRWLELNPSEAMDYASSLGSCNSQLVTTLADQWAVLDPSAAAEWAANLSNLDQRNKVLSSLVAVWAHQSPEEAANFVLNLPPDSTRDETVISVVSAWSRQDPQAVVAWLDEIPESVAKQQALQQVSTLWAKSDPWAAEGWLQGQTASDSRDAAISSYSSVVAHTSPAKAFEWAEQIQDESVRNRQLEFLAAGWLRRDPINAQRAILQSGLTDERKQQLLNAVHRSDSRN